MTILWTYTFYQVLVIIFIAYETCLEKKIFSTQAGSVSKSQLVSPVYSSKLLNKFYSLLYFSKKLNVSQDFHEVSKEIFKKKKNLFSK